MNHLKTKIKAKQENKMHIPKNQTPRAPSPLAKAIKRLSFSFYAEDTIKRSKQIILDNCDLTTELPMPTNCSRSRPLKSTRLSCQPSRLSKQKKNCSNLEMEKYFFEQKYDEIDLVPTNASHLEHKSRESSLSKVKNPTHVPISKSKKQQSRPLEQPRKCQTALGRRGSVKSVKSQRKTTKKKAPVN